MNDPQAAVTYDVTESVGYIKLNRPEAMNSLDRATKEALRDAVEDAASGPARAVVLTASGRAFCVGQDLREHAASLESTSLDEVWSTVQRHYSPIARGLATMDKPVIAAINGVAAGAGAGLAFACDFRISAESAGFNLAFTGIGLSSDTGTSWTLPRLVGVAKATELMMTPRTLDAQEALALGLVSKVVPDGELAAEAHELAVRLAAGPTVAYAAVRRALLYGSTHSLDESLDFEAEMMRLTGGTEDHRNAVSAFLAKEKPVFEGR
ncbi:MAG: enoyl-CoA hydratase [Propionibacteriales bacterium]|nr:enoyl-CoA hydratase [Propionibacteriales bacterium]